MSTVCPRSQRRRRRPPSRPSRPTNARRLRARSSGRPEASRDDLQWHRRPRRERRGRGGAPQEVEAANGMPAARRYATNRLRRFDGSPERGRAGREARITLSRAARREQRPAVAPCPFSATGRPHSAPGFALARNGLSSRPHFPPPEGLSERHVLRLLDRELIKSEPLVRGVKRPRLAGLDRDCEVFSSARARLPRDLPGRAVCIPVGDHSVPVLELPQFSDC